MVLVLPPSSCPGGLVYNPKKSYTSSKVEGSALEDLLEDQSTLVDIKQIIASLNGIGLSVDEILWREHYLASIPSGGANSSVCEDAEIPVVIENVETEAKPSDETHNPILDELTRKLSQKERASSPVLRFHRDSLDPADETPPPFPRKSEKAAGRAPSSSEVSIPAVSPSVPAPHCVPNGPQCVSIGTQCVSIGTQPASNGSQCVTNGSQPISVGTQPAFGAVSGPQYVIAVPQCVSADPLTGPQSVPSGRPRGSAGRERRAGRSGRSGAGGAAGERAKPRCDVDRPLRLQGLRSRHGPNSNGPNYYGPNSNGSFSNESYSNGPNNSGPNRNGSISNGPNNIGPINNGSESNRPNNTGPTHDAPTHDAPTHYSPTNHSAPPSPAGAADAPASAPANPVFPGESAHAGGAPAEEFIDLSQEMIQQTRRAPCAAQLADQHVFVTYLQCLVCATNTRLSPPVAYSSSSFSSATHSSFSDT